MTLPTEYPERDFSRHKNLGELHTLLLTACPADETGRVSIPVLAKNLGVSNQYLYKWINDKKVPPGYVRQLVELSEGRLDYEAFHPYVFT